ncbi:AAA family ATPase, partial [Anabaena cylindrica UHCC 0172]|uniref:AAA family ATPase n=1 Tax=Anabaena cylindrica TaxID=1165 RepID=UPI002B2203E6
MLQSIRIQRLKKFKDVEVYLSPFTVLMGENSSGKTTVLQSINLALTSLANERFIENDGQNVKIKNKGFGSSTLPGLSISDYKEAFYAKVPRGGKAGGAGGINLELKDIKNNNYKLQIRSLFGSFNIKCISEPIDLSNNPELHLHLPLYREQRDFVKSGKKCAFSYS